MKQIMKKQPGPLSGGRISGERVPAEDCRCEDKRFSGLQCLYWQREWGDVPKAITEATMVVKPGQHKPKAAATPKPKK
jgi:hypothetical protein